MPGYRRCLELAGVSRPEGPADPFDPPPPPVEPEPLPTDVAALTERVEELELQNRLEREKIAPAGASSWTRPRKNSKELKTEQEVEATPRAELV